MDADDNEQKMSFYVGNTLYSVKMQTGEVIHTVTDDRLNRLIENPKCENEYFVALSIPSSNKGFYTVKVFNKYISNDKFEFEVKGGLTKMYMLTDRSNRSTTLFILHKVEKRLVVTQKVIFSKMNVRNNSTTFRLMVEKFIAERNVVPIDEEKLNSLREGLVNLLVTAPKRLVHGCQDISAIVFLLDDYQLMREFCRAEGMLPHLLQYNNLLSICLYFRKSKSIQAIVESFQEENKHLKA